jgi:amidophosphoribosyltransferase
LKETKNEKLMKEVYKLAKLELLKPKNEVVNVAKKIYEPFTYEDISSKIASMLKTPQIKADVKIVYQTIEGLSEAIPNHKGDWYFSGNYPTPGGMCVANKAFINYVDGNNNRAY